MSVRLKERVARNCQERFSKGSCLSPLPTTSPLKISLPVSAVLSPFPVLNFDLQFIFLSSCSEISSLVFKETAHFFFT